MGGGEDDEDETGDGDSPTAEQIVRVKWLLSASATADAMVKSAAARRQRMVEEVLSLVPTIAGASAAGGGGGAGAAASSDTLMSGEGVSRANVEAALKPLWERELQQLLDAHRRAYGDATMRPTDPMELWEAKDTADGMVAALVEEWRDTVATSGGGGGGGGGGGEGEEADVAMGSAMSEGVDAAAAAPPGSLLAVTATLSEAARQFQTQLYQLLQAAATPQPMSPSMMEAGDVHRPLLEGYSWPKLTPATFVELVARLCGAARCAGLLDGVVDHLFTVDELALDATARPRLLNIYIECCARFTSLSPALNPATLAAALPLQQPSGGSGSGSGSTSTSGATAAATRTTASGGAATVTAWMQVKPRYDVTAQRGGVFEPALCVALLQDDAVLARVEEASGKWVHSEDSDAPVNLLFALLQSLPAAQAQLLDNVMYDATCHQLGVLLPRHAIMSEAAARTAGASGGGAGAGAGGGAGAGAGAVGGGVVPALGSFAHLVVFDVQRYELVADPVSFVEVLGSVVA